MLYIDNSHTIPNEFIRCEYCFDDDRVVVIDSDNDYAISVCKLMDLKTLLPGQCLSFIMIYIINDVVVKSFVEDIIATDPHCSYWYSTDVIKERFVKGEPAISTKIYKSYQYAITHQFKFELAEHEFAKSAMLAAGYATKVIKSRFELGEPIIATNAMYSYNYAKYIMRGRFELGEPAIATDTHYSYLYARDVLKSRFELGEAAIAKSIESSYYYALDVLNGRFELGEATITGDDYFTKKYFELTGIQL